MPRVHYLHELQHIRDELLMMASMVYQALDSSVQALRTHDIETAQRIIVADMDINRKRFGVENDILTIIATQQPMAGDMRMLAGALEIAGELERIGDYGKGIARITLMLGREPLLAMPAHLTLMAQHALSMLRRAIDAYIAQDVDAAKTIPYTDDALDELYNQVALDLFNAVIADATKFLHSNYYSWAAHNLERTGDRAVNICERTIYTVTGDMNELDYMEEGIAGID